MVGYVKQLVGYCNKRHHLTQITPEHALLFGPNYWIKKRQFISIHGLYLQESG
jgi:hypothetical protein